MTEVMPDLTECGLSLAEEVAETRLQHAQVQILTEVAQLLKMGWCQGVSAKNSQGFAVIPSDPTARSWCLLGALERAVVAYGQAHPYHRLPILTSLIDLLAMPIPAHMTCEPIRSVPLWNDLPERTHAEVLAHVERVRASLVK